MQLVKISVQYAMNMVRKWFNLACLVFVVVFFGTLYEDISGNLFNSIKVELLTVHSVRIVFGVVLSCCIKKSVFLSVKSLP